MSAISPDPSTPQGETHPDAPLDGAAILADILKVNGPMVRDESQATRAKELIDALQAQVQAKTVVQAKAKDNVVAAIQQGIATIDERMGALLDSILHDPKFQALEGRWRGLNYLVMNTETSTRLKIRVLNATKKEIGDDLAKAPEFDRSLLFKKVYEAEYGTFGGNPFSMLMGDYDFNASAPDVAMLRGLSSVAAAAHAPFISAASPDLFDMGSWATIGQPGDLARIFESTRLIGYREFRETEDSRYVTLTLPRVLFRLPYSTKDAPITSFVYDENVFTSVTAQKDDKGNVVTQSGRTVMDRVGQNEGNFLFGNAAYALTQRITNAFATYGWTAAIRGVEGGGLVENLPVHLFKTSDGDSEVKCPTEVAITDRRENELSELGFIALCYRRTAARPPSSAPRRPTSPRPTSTPRPSRTRASRRSSPTSSRPPASRTTSR